MNPEIKDMQFDPTFDYEVRSRVAAQALTQTPLEVAEEAEFEEVNPRPIKLQNAGLSGAFVSGSTAVYNKTTHPTLTSDCRSAFDEAQYEANRSSDLIMSQKHHSYRETEAEPEQTPFINFLKKRNTTNYIKPVKLEAKRAAKRKAQRKARRAAR